VKHVSSQKARDAAVVADVVRRFGPLSRVDIHQLTNLRPGTISQLVRELLKQGRFEEAGPSDNPMGRKQIRLRFNEEYESIVGIEFDAEMVAAAVMDLHPRIKAIVKEDTRLSTGIDGLVNQLLSCTRKTIKQSHVRSGSLLGIVLADPGLVDSREGVSVLSSTIDFWKGVPLKKIFEKEFGVPFVLESNTRARTVAERTLGAGEMADDMIYLDYGAGIGLGIYTEGKLFRGRKECACEFGHTRVVEGGPACKCGSFGCLEAVAGAPAIGTRIRKAVIEGAHSRVLEQVGGDPANITGWSVFEAAKLGDRLCSQVMENVAHYLGLGLGNLVNLFNPAVVVLDQRLELAGQGFLDQMIRIVKRQALQRSTEDLEFRFSRLGSEAGVLGVAILLLERLFEIPVLKPPRFMIEPPGGKYSLAGRKAVSAG
jgi:predicted NBD/HSP70 family sugar kinase